MKIEFDIGSDQIDAAHAYQKNAFMLSQLAATANGKSSALVIMADATSNHAAGNIASNMVVATFNKYFQSNSPAKRPDKILHDAVLSSNQQIALSVKKTPALSGMGCTMISAYLEGENLWWLSVGASHLYLIRDEELVKQNADPSYGAFLDRMGEQGEEVNKNSGMARDMLMSSMTGVKISSIDCPDTPVKVKAGDRIIIASDGLGSIDGDTITQYSICSDTAKQCVSALLKALADVKRKNQHTTTIIVVDIKETEKAPELKLQCLSEEPQNLASPKKPITDINIADANIKDAEKSSAIFLQLLLFIILAGSGYYAWLMGLVDDGLSVAAELITKDIAIDDYSDSTPTASTPIEKKASLEKPKALVYQDSDKPPAIKQAAKTFPKIAVKPFQDRMKNGQKAPLMVTIPAGSFRMGGPSNLVAPDETPRHQVSIKTFAMSQYEITFAEYEMYAVENNKKLPDSNNWDKASHPVTRVSWHDASEYAQWLSRQTGFKYRLPTESEWEYAARSGSRSSFWWGNSKGIANAQCFNCGVDLNPSKPAKIGSFKANKFSLFDIHGNVFEWTHDCYHANYNNAPSDGSPREGGDCSMRVARGGAFASPASSMKSENREKFDSNRGRDHIGIRLVREL